MNIIIDAGHGGQDFGATFKEAKEKDITLSIAKKVANNYILGKKIMTRERDEMVPLEKRVQIANNSGYDFFISIHCNADPDPDIPGMPEGKGEEIWYCQGSKKGEACAKALASFVDMFFLDEPFRGCKAGNFYVLRKTIMPAVLVEVGFIDNSKTIRELQDDYTQEEISRWLVCGIMNVKQILNAMKQGG